MNVNAEEVSGPAPALEPPLILKVVVAASFVPFVVKVVGYAAIVSYVPLAVFLVFTILAAWGLSSGRTRLKNTALKAWAVALMLWGLARLGLLGLHLTLEIPEAHIAGQFTAWYVVITVLHILLGVLILRMSGGRSSTN